ncbi:hypothetical protein [Bradyrhizobium lablabi]|uniref:hypothetical protein n=1 Tax=Bradyrhizobium lablabi TaxID=722472 RepID=UPI0015611883|nr:hypothetical protein [Bradyrhizobium lablabi]
MGPAIVTAMAVTGTISDDAAKVIAAKTIATATETAAAGKCARGKSGTSENKDNCENIYGVAQH